MTDIKQHIKDFIVEMTFSNPDNINYDTLIFEEGIFDSMGMLSLIDLLKNEYNIIVPDDEILEENFGNINRIVEYIKRKIT
jgi:acyl carrier protein